MYILIEKYHKDNYIRYVVKGKQMHQNTIISFVLSEQKANESLKQVLTRILKSKTLQNVFFDTILKNPRYNKSAYRFFLSGFSTLTARRKWYQSYVKSYSQYVNQVFKKAEKIEDVVQMFPNFSPWSLEQRFSDIKMGQVPDIFGSEASFLSFVAQINKSTAVRNFKMIKKLECSLPEFTKAFPAVKKIDWFNFSKRSVFLRKLLKEKCAKPFTIVVNQKKFKINFLCNPFSCKMVFLITDPTGKEFILKSLPYTFLNIRNDRVRKEHENMAIRADSTYSNAMLEFYLKLNQCDHVADILYYNFKHEIVLYAVESGMPFHIDENKNKFLDFYSFNTKIVPDAVRLGVYINDINEGNFIRSSQDNKIKIIDIGHATFANPLTPGIPGLTFTLGNLCGQDYMSINGVLDVEDV